MDLDCPHTAPAPTLRSRLCTGLRIGSCSLLLLAGIGLVGAGTAHAGIEVYRHDDGDGSVRYTIRRVPDPEPEAEADAAPAEDEAPRTEPPSVDSAGSREPTASELSEASTEEDIQRQIERDREVLRELVSGKADAPLDARETTTLRKIAERLPRLQSELEALESEPTP